MLYRIVYDEVNINVFSINQNSGEMILQNNIDEDEHRRFTVLVEAKDLGSPQPLASIMPVYITVTDVNDNQPIFDKGFYRYFSVLFLLFHTPYARCHNLDRFTKVTVGSIIYFEGVFVFIAKLL